MISPPVHGHPRHAAEHAVQAAEPAAAAVAVERGYDTAPFISPVQVAGAVRAKAADQGTAGTLALSAANPVLMALPADPGRCRAVLIAAGATCYLAESRELAQAAAAGSTTAGALLPAGYPVELASACEWWVASSNPGAGVTVSVISERHADPGPG